MLFEIIAYDMKLPSWSEERTWNLAQILLHNVSPRFIDFKLSRGAGEMYMVPAAPERQEEGIGSTGLQLQVTGSGQN